MTAAEIYLYLAIISSSLLGIFILLNFFGLDIDDLDVDFGLGDFFSFNSVIAMGAVAGWTGYIGHNLGMQSWVIHAISVSIGLVAYVASIYLLDKLKGLESSGTVILDNAIGCTGTVYLGIPEKEKGSGQIQAVVQGRLLTLDAKTTREALETGKSVLIYDVKDNFVYVESFTPDN